jgi:hypothetical protein
MRTLSVILIITTIVVFSAAERGDARRFAGGGGGSGLVNVALTADNGVAVESDDIRVVVTP